MYNRLLKFIDKNNLLNEFQFGFGNKPFNIYGSDSSFVEFSNSYGQW